MRVTAETEFGIYLHWPFCQAKCPYCDFNSHVADRVDQDQWAEAFEAEIARSAAEVGPKLVSSIYFGGGTPSLMLPSTVDRILNSIRKAWSLRNDVEITLEANPSSVEATRFAGYREAGVNRVSMGFQALNDTDLAALGRLHDVETAIRALTTARATFDRVNFDLIYARQNQSLADWSQELGRALSFDPSHLSLYQLTIEDGTAFAKRFAAGALRGLPSEDLSVDMYELTQDLCDAKGLTAYEVSNHALPGQESVHNLIYWRGGDYLGIGPGAHGRLTDGTGRLATEGARAPGDWLNRVQTKGIGESYRAYLTATEWAEERLMMGLRTNEGVDLQKMTDLTGHSVATACLDSLNELGHLRVTKGRIRATASGRLLLNAVLRELVSNLNQSAT